MIAKQFIGEGKETLGQKEGSEARKTISIRCVIKSVITVGDWYFTLLRKLWGSA